jgi:branched-chain amino acid transport system permease protein
MGYLLTVLLQFIQFTIIAVGMNMVFSVGGMYFHGAPAVYIVAAYSLAITQVAGWSLAASLSLSLVLSLILAACFSLLQKRFTTDTFEVITIAITLGMISVVSSWLSLTNGPLGISSIPRPEGFTSLESMVVLNGTALILMLLAAHVLLNSRFGRALRGAKEHPNALESLGLSKTRVRTGAIFFAIFILTFVAWSSVWEFRFVTPSTYGIPGLVEAASIAILAAKPKIRYILFSGAVISLTPEILRFVDLPSASFGYLRNMIYSVIIILFILVFRKKLSLTKRTV